MSVHGCYKYSKLKITKYNKEILRIYIYPKCENENEVIIVEIYE